MIRKKALLVRSTSACNPDGGGSTHSTETIEVVIEWPFEPESGWGRYGTVGEWRLSEPSRDPKPPEAGQA